MDFCYDEKMDGNKDESERCISLAQKCLAAGDTSKALKFLNKAEKLYPSQKAKGNKQFMCEKSLICRVFLSVCSPFVFFFWSNFRILY